MKALITGANGFIGTYLSQYLSKLNIHVLATTRINRPGLFDLSETLTQATWDVLNENEPSVEDIPDVVIHVATSNDILSKNTFAGYELSLKGTIQVLNFAKQKGIKNIILFSTFQVYGTELQGTIDEQTPVNCQNHYGLNHKFAEECARLFCTQNNINLAIVRPSNVYGEIKTVYTQRWTLVPACFCKEIFNTGEITLLSSGLQNRNFVSLEDVSFAIFCLINNFNQGVEVYNIASQTYKTIAEVALIVKEIYEIEFKQEGKIVTKSNLPLYSNQFYVNLSKMEQINYSPQANITLTTEIIKIFNLLKNANDE